METKHEITFWDDFTPEKKPVFSESQLMALNRLRNEHNDETERLHKLLDQVAELRDKIRERNKVIKTVEAGIIANVLH